MPVAGGPGGAQPAGSAHLGTSRPTAGTLGQLPKRDPGLVTSKPEEVTNGLLY